MWDMSHSGPCYSNKLKQPLNINGEMGESEEVSSFWILIALYSFKRLSSAVVIKSEYSRRV